MQLSTEILLLDRVYRVAVKPDRFTAAEQEMLARFGEPLIEVGGTFEGTYSRPNRTSVTLTFSGGGGSGAAATVTAVNLNGGLLTLEISDGGSSYETAPTVAVVGDGFTAAVTATVVDGVVTALTIGEAGYGYTLSPVEVEFDLPAKTSRLRTDAPIVAVFDLRDDVNSDIKAKAFADTIVDRIQTAMLELQAQKAAFVSQTVITTP